MTGSEYRYVLNTIENEGFEYSFTGYSDFKDRVKDPKFHELRVAYLKAMKALADYIGYEEFCIATD